MQSLTCPGIVSVDTTGLVASCSEAWQPAPWFPLSADQLNALILACLGVWAAIYLVRAVAQAIRHG